MAMDTYGNGASESRDDDLRRTILDFIQNYLGNDPLEPYLRCIKWLKEMTPPGSVKVVLQEVLELAATTFVPDKRYKSDLRYLKVWIQYADCCLERGGIFPYLEANGIGLEHGLFYEAYSMLLESSRDYSKADYVFQIGISRGAQPLERVIAMYNNFRSRMVARQRRKIRQEQEQKALLIRLSGGAMRPLADSHGIEGLPTLPSFQSNSREDPLPDMQDSFGSYAGPAPVRIGSKIYESTGLKAESSFEEERVSHWIQKNPPQLSYATPMVSNNEQVIPDSTHIVSKNVHQPLNRPGVVMDSIHYNLTGQKEATSNGYLGGAPNLSTNFAPTQSISARVGFSGAENVPMRPATMHSAVHTSAHDDLSRRLFTNEAGMELASQNELLDDVSIVTKSVTDDIMAMFGEPTLQTESRPPREYASLLPAHQDVFKTGMSYLNESKAGIARAGQSDDITMSTKSVTDDILTMFDAPQKLSETGKSYNAGTQRNGSNVEVLDDVTIDTKSVTDDIMAMFSGSPAPRARVKNSTYSNMSYIRSLESTPSQNGVLRSPVALSQPVGSIQNSLTTPSSGDLESKTVNARVDYKLTTSPIQQHPSQVLRNGATPSQTREVVSVRKDGTSPNQKHMESATVGQWVTNETRSSVIVENSMAEASVVQDLSNGKGRFIKENSSYDDGNVRSTPSRKRSSWSTSANDTQCIYLSDEDEKVDSGEKKKQRVPLTSNGGKDSETPVLNRSLALREKRRPTQYSPAIGSAPIENVASSNGESFVLRNILEPTLSRTEHIKPGGQIYPWDQELISNFLKYLNPPLSEYKGYVYSSKKYSGKVTLSSLASTKSGVKNKPLELGCSKYQLKASTGHGAFAQVYLAEALSKTGDRRRVVLKVQKPPCPWEFYIYRQLDMRIPSEERCSYGCAQNIHIFADCSFMECDFGQYGTLQDVINSYLKNSQRMDEPLCIFYTIEMLRMLEDLHKVGLIHGDFKPDNLLIRSSRVKPELQLFLQPKQVERMELTVGMAIGSAHLGFWTPAKPGAWKQQGVCLIDWGRSIDLSLFAEGTEFVGDSKTDGFRCTEMIEKKPWTFQVDTYGLCGVAHCLLHGSYMEIEKRSSNATSQVIYRPKAPYKRYWNVNLWQNFFETLLNLNTDNCYNTLHKLRKSFEDYLGSDSGLTKKLRELLVKQNTMLLSRK